LVRSDDFNRNAAALTTLLKGIRLAAVQKLLGPHPRRSTVIDLNFSETQMNGGFERKWSWRG
jgi:hypothetical protein